MRIAFKIYFPGGNRTALVFQRIPKPQHAKIARAVMAQQPGIEQVGFVSNFKTRPHLDMMGGEFCGNAARCLGYELLRGNHQLKFSVSGYHRKILARIDNAAVTIELAGDFLRNIKPHVLGFEVNFQGISFVVTEKKRLNLNPEKFLRQFGAGHTAAGLIRLVKKPQGYVIFPLIYVPSTRTLIEESACASGSIAAALVLNQQGKGKTFSLIQPSGKKLKVSLGFKKGTLDRVKFSGPVVFEGPGLIDV